ncbi:GYF domain-containing protein [Pseudozyma hubeiensis]|nr:GYF domain-containing protein [Pseudozyma hubeiensis]
MSMTDKRKASSAAVGASSLSGASSSKRIRIDESSQRRRKREETDFFDGDPEIEEEDRRRIRKDQKSGRIDDRGEDLSESDESDDNGADLFNDDSDAEADAGSHRRRAEKKRRGDAAGAAGDDDDEDMFDVVDDEKQASGSSKAKQKDRARDDYLKLGELEAGQDFGSKNRSTLDAADDDVELLKGGGRDDDDDLDPDLELEDDDDQDDADQAGSDRDGYVDLNAMAERSPPTSPGGTPTNSGKGRRNKTKQQKAPKVTGFNMKEEMRSGKFDADGNYHENQRDPHAQHDAWLTGVYSKSKILEARKAQQKRDQEAKEKEQAAQQADGDEDEVKKRLVERMHRAETVQRTLQRLGKVLADKKKQLKAEEILEEEHKQAATDVESVTHLSSVLMSRFGRLDIYDQTYEQLLHDVHKSGLVRQTFDPAAKFDPPAVTESSIEVTSGDSTAEWEYRWTPSYLAAAARESGTPVDPEIQVFGPFNLADLKGWAEQGYFGDGGERILLRRKGTDEAWQAYNHVVTNA